MTKNFRLLGAIICFSVFSAQAQTIHHLGQGSGFDQKQGGASLAKPNSNSSMAKAIDVEAIMTNLYVPGATQNLYFQLSVLNDDAEFGDSLSLTFPDGITINSVSNDLIFADFGEDSEVFNGIDGSVITWGDNDNIFGGIYSSTTYNFQVNVTIDPTLSGDQIIQGFMSGDEFGDDPADQSFTLVMVEGPNEAKVQIIHNSADSDAATVDVRVNGNFPDESFDDLDFRTATPFLTVPASTDLNVTINLPDSEDDSEALFTQTFNLDPGVTYIIVADGIVSPTGYDPATPFTLEAFVGAVETSADANETLLLAHHGATDAPEVDILVPTQGLTLVDDISYSEFEGYVELATEDYFINVTTADNSTVVNTYSAPLATLGLGGDAITVVASGFLDPSVNSDGPEFGLWVALASGGPMVELPAVVVDVPNDSPCDAIALTEGVVEVGNNGFATADEDEVVPPRGACSGTLTWCDGPSSTQAGFDGFARVNNSIWFSFVAPSSGSVLINTCNIETDFDTQVAVYSATDCSDYDTFTLVAANDDFDASTGGECDSESLYASRLRACSLTEGETYYVQVDGYLDPQNAVSSSGSVGISVTELDVIDCSARLQVVHNSPDAAAATVDIRVNGAFPAEDYDDLMFRHATATINVPAGLPLSITVNGASSQDTTGAILTINDVVLSAGASYQVIAQGIASADGYTPGSDQAPLELILVTGFLEVSDGENNTSVLVSHGAPDAPNVDIINAFSLSTEYVSNLAYGDIEGYLTLPADNITLSVTPAGSDDIVASYFAPLDDLDLGGDAITIFASGFLNPDVNSDGPGFGLWASLPTGGALIELQNVTGVDEVDALARMRIFPNPTSDQFLIDFDLISSERITIDLVNLAGQIVKSVDLGQRSTGANLERIDVKNVAAGFYLLNMTIGSDQIITKLQINK